MLNHMTSSAILRRWIPPAIRAVGSFRSMTSGESVTNNNPISPPLTLPPLQQFLEGDTELVGWTEDWVALFDKRNNDLFLSDFLSHRRIKLPPIHTLPDPEFNLDLDGRGSVSKVVLSSSPEDDDCRAMMTFGPGNRLAFCSPGRSSEWTPVGGHFYEYDHHYPFESVARFHEDLVYCTKRKVFTSITPVHLELERLGLLEHVEGRFEAMRFDWDVEDPRRPKLVRSEELYLHERFEIRKGKEEEEDGVISARRWLVENREVLDKECVQIPHLVYEEDCDETYVVVQFVRVMKDDGESPLGYVPACELNGLAGVFPGKTFGFLAFLLDDGDREVYRARKCWAMSTLSGTSMFVGMNNSFEFKHKPYGIYFADNKRLKRLCCVNDHGVFDYPTKTILPVSLSYSTPEHNMELDIGCQLYYQL